MRCHKSSLKREVCSDKCLPILTKKKANNFTLQLKGLGKKEHTKPRFSKKKEIKRSEQK